MAEPLIRLNAEGGLWVRQLHFVHATDVHIGHLHSHDHVTLLATGSLQVTVDGVSQTFNAPHIILITKGKHHDLQAMVDGTVAYCVAPIADVTTS